jgi:hypothetical protein
MYFIYENGRMKPIEIVLRTREWGRGRTMEGGIYLRYIASIYVNITMYPMYR